MMQLFGNLSGHGFFVTDLVGAVLNFVFGVLSLVFGTLGQVFNVL